MIIEGIITTKNQDGTINVSPMGPICEDAWQYITLRPFQTSRTYQNLRRHGEGVFHVTDDVDLLARAAIGWLDNTPAFLPAKKVDGMILADTCRWYAFRVERLDDSDERTRIECTIVDQGRRRDFLGFNRAKHAVVEAAILATRVHLLPADEIRQQMARLSVIVNKTAGDQELGAFALLDRYIEQSLADQLATGQKAV